MEDRFCSDLIIRNNIIKCITTSKGIPYCFVFVGDDLMETDEKIKKNSLVYYTPNDGIHIYGKVIKVKGKECEIKLDDYQRENTKIIMKEKDELRIRPNHELIVKLQENKQLSEKEEIQLAKYLGMNQSLIQDTLFHTDIESIFIWNDRIHEDDTNKIVKMKLAKYCYTFLDPTDYIPSDFIYAVYENDGEIIPIDFGYEKIKMNTIDDLYSGPPCSLIDKSFIDENDDKKDNNQYDNSKKLFTIHEINSKTLFFTSIKEYLTFHKLDGELEDSEKLKQLHCNQDVVQTIKSFENGVLKKFWPFLHRNDINNITQRRETCIEEDITLLQYFREYDIVNRSIPDTEKPHCDHFEITYFKISKESPELNLVDLPKLFSKFQVTNDVPFVKLVLDTHNDKYYKLKKDSILYSNSRENNDIQIVDKKLCVDWSEDFYTQSKYANAVNFIHSKNVILFKVCLDTNLDIYATLVIHMNGDIECIIKKRKYNPQLTEERNQAIYYQTSGRSTIHVFIQKCNQVIQKINEDKVIFSNVPIVHFGSEEDIQELFFNPRQEKIKVDFIDCQIEYENENYEDAQGNVFPHFSSGENLFGQIISNLSMYFRVKIEEEEGGSNQIYAHYKRVNNYANQDTIQSTFRAYSNIYMGDDEKVLKEVYRDFGKDMSIEEIKEEYEIWKETMRMKEQQPNGNIQNNIEEEGPDLIISKKDNSVQISVQGISSFDMLKRLLSILTRLMNIYRKYFMNEMNRRLLEKDTEYIHEYIQVLYGEKEEIEVSSSSSSTLSDFNDDDSDGDDDDDSDDDDGKKESSTSSSLDFGDSSDSFGGGGKETFNPKSYYMNRLKKYDSELFKFKSLQKQPNGQPVGYSKKCTASPSLGDRQPIAVTRKELKRINDLSGEESYGGVAISIDGRSQDIIYICPEYWDMSKKISLEHEYVQEHHSNDIVQKRGSESEKFILERSGTYWNSAKDKEGEERSRSFVVEEAFHGLHPDGYGLPCCKNKSTRNIKKKKKPVQPEQERTTQEKTTQEKTTQEKITQEKITQEKITQEKTKKIDTKKKVYLPTSIGMLNPSFPTQLLKLFAQSFINIYDERISIKGFMRKGVPYKNDKYFDYSSFFTSYLALHHPIEVNKIQDYIKDSIIRPLENDIEKLQLCSSVIKKFKDVHQTDEDVLENVERILLENEREDKYEYRKYLLSLYSSFKSFRLYLEESNSNVLDEYIVPVLQVIHKVNIIIFENPEKDIHRQEDSAIKLIHYSYEPQYPTYFMYKYDFNGDFNYEPIVYSIYGGKYGILSRFSLEMFDGFYEDNPEKYCCKKADLEQILGKTYPRGREKLYVDKGNTELNNTLCKRKISKLVDNLACVKVWIPYEEYKANHGIPKKNTPVKLIQGRETIYGELTEHEKGDDFWCMFIPQMEDAKGNLRYKCSKFAFESKEYGLSEKLRDILDPKRDGWEWISKNLSDRYYDRDIESKIRKKNKPEDDKLLLSCSKKAIYDPKNKKMKLLLGSSMWKKALSAEYYLLKTVIQDINDQIGKKEQSDFEKKETIIKEKKYTIKGLFVNQYSEITYILCKDKKRKRKLVIPIKPEQITTNLIQKGYPFVYDFNYPEWDNILEEDFGLEIQTIVLNNPSEKLIKNIIFKNGTYLPIKNEPWKDDKDERIIYNGIDLFELEQSFNDEEEEATENDLSQYEKDEQEKKESFLELIQYIYNHKYSIQGSVYNDVIQGDSIYFKYVQGSVEEIKKVDVNYDSHYGQVRKIVGDKVFMECSLLQKIKHIIDDKIVWREHKKEKIIEDLTIKIDDKIIYEFVDKLTIYGVDNILAILNENINTDNLCNSEDKNAVCYTEIDYRYHNILDKIFNKESEYIVEEEKTIDKVEDMKEIIQDKVPYYINELYGSQSVISYHLNGEISNSMTLSVGIRQEQEESGRPIIDPIEKEDSEFSFTDFDKRIQEIKKKSAYDLCILIVYKNTKKQNVIRFFESETMTKQTKVISFFQGEDKKISNIISDGKYALPIQELYELNEQHKKWIHTSKLKMGDLDEEAEIEDLEDREKALQSKQDELNRKKFNKKLEDAHLEKEIQMNKEEMKKIRQLIKKKKRYKIGATVGWVQGGEDISGVIIRIVKKECIIRADDGEEYMKKMKDVKLI